MSRRSRGGRPRRLPTADTAPNPPGSSSDVAEPSAAFDRPAPVLDPPAPVAPLPPPRSNGAPGGQGSAGCTAPQLRRFIKSRVYVPLHELRRRFGIDGSDDDVHAVELESGRIFVGLPAYEARLLEELLRGGDVGFELSRDPSTPIVIGVYPMRPVARP